MDNIWDRKPSMSEVIGRCGRDEKRMTKKSIAKKTNRLYCQLYKTLFTSFSFILILPYYKQRQFTLNFKKSHNICADVFYNS